jgi:hypothetical protein
MGRIAILDRPEHESDHEYDEIRCEARTRCSSLPPDSSHADANFRILLAFGPRTDHLRDVCNCRRCINNDQTKSS